ncbi:hypothetical protein CI109_101475 [Kwoniella shandongensis]|uniref:Uncharacterized protein n=1 Tax=Kwoniella shandongensis TaxID=1734106 RepID=A0A5M6C2Z5_9TREE|nr:uncharacterized protein CI109_001933 [Kwoniella shandongensis]KAA5529508.1 hypothetical protein CI109_001933 [Kwoniella shandongensis]
MAHFRDSQPVIVHCDTDVIRGSVGSGELFSRPTTSLKARYAVPRASSSKAVETNGDVSMGEEEPTHASEGTSRHGWVVGEELDTAEKEDGWEEKYDVRWPFRPSKDAEDWDGREFVLSHFYSLLGLKVANNSSPLLFIPPPTPPTLPLSTQALYTQLAFEGLNVPIFSILPSPLASLFALGATTGIVIHVGRHESSIFVITDSVVRWECSTTALVGEADCEEWFERLLMRDEALAKELRLATEKETLDEEEKRKLVKEIASVVWNECTGDDIEVPAAKVESGAVVISTLGTEKEDDAFDVAKKLVGDNAPPPAAHSHKSKKQQAQAQAAAVKSAADAAAADTIVINIPSLPEKEISLGPVRHRLCDPLLFGKTPGGDTVWEAVGRAVENASLSVNERLGLWEGVGVVGELARIKSFAPALVTYLSPFLLSSPDLPSDCQPSKIRLLSIPEYFANYKNATTELAPFLGASLVSKVAFSDLTGKHCITKVDYNAKGPAAIYTVTNEDR